MILTLTYNKSTKELTLDDDEPGMEAIINNVVDNSGTLSLEVSLNTSSYQIQFNEIDADGNDN